MRLTRRALGALALQAVLSRPAYDGGTETQQAVTSGGTDVGVGAGQVPWSP